MIQKFKTQENGAPETGEAQINIPDISKFEQHVKAADEASALREKEDRIRDILYAMADKAKARTSQRQKRFVPCPFCGSSLCPSSYYEEY